MRLKESKGKVQTIRTQIHTFINRDFIQNAWPANFREMMQRTPERGVLEWALYEITPEEETTTN